MELFVSEYNTKTDTIKRLYIVEQFNHFIWTERYNQCSDFELSVLATKANLSIFKINRFLSLRSSDSNKTMIIETLSTETNTDSGDILKVSGRSLESILDRRIVWNPLTFKPGKSIQGIIKKLITDAFMTETINGKANPRYFGKMHFSTNPDLDIANGGPFIEEDASQDYGIQYYGENVYDTICELCQNYGLGFRLIIDENNNDRFSFRLFKGKDRTYENTDGNSYVIFSRDFNNLITSTFFENSQTYKTTALILGEGNGTKRKHASVKDTKSGFYRREVLIEAHDASSTTYDEDGTEHVLTDKEYTVMLQKKGNEELKKHKRSVSFDAELETSQQFIYKRDYSIGDIVSVDDGYGHEWRSRIIEVIISFSSDSGFKIYPTFNNLDDEEEV